MKCLTFDQVFSASRKISKWLARRGKGRLIAVGDIHGCLDQLQALIAKINPRPTDRLVFLGDYVDRGPESCGVLDYLITFQKKFPKTVFLRGNHEWLMLDSLTEVGIQTGTPFLYSVSRLWDRETAWMCSSEDNNCLLWRRNQGESTLISYGIDLHDYMNGPPTLDAYRKAFEKIPREHIEFLSSTKLWYESGHILFVHAGVNPTVNLVDNDPYNLIWSREGFWRYKSGWTRCVVHGHTPVGRPHISRFEIAIDTGAGNEGPLTACDVRTGGIWNGRYIKGHLSTTPMGYLPGVFCTTCESDIFCSRKGEPNYTLLFFFQHVPDDPQVPDGHFRDLACLQFDFLVHDPAKAEALAKASWKQYRDQILALNGDRLYITDFDSRGRKSKK
jgi:serine/threonine protein phosphatase 1